MAADQEPAKLLLPYLQRADELQKHEPLVAYYCRLYAMERGMKIPQKERTKTTNSLLISLMSQLEKDKKSLTLGPDDHLHVEGFASNVFSKADKQDRAGRADLNTAKTFYAASIFFEILNQFGEVQPDLEQKQKYAVWKAADIRKAMKEGRKPVPGPPGGDDDDSSLQANGEYDSGPRENDFAIRPDPSIVNPSATIPPVSDSLTPPYNDLQHSTSFSSQSLNAKPSPSNISTPHHYPDNSRPPENYHQPPTSNVSEHPQYPESYTPQQPYPLEPQQHYSTQSYPFQNFQSYPSFTESSLPTVPLQHPSYYQSSDASYSNFPPPANTANYQSSLQYDSVARQGTVSDVAPITAHKYEYDSSYEPPPEHIAEAQKAARFAVGALAFDDVFVAVDHLKKALDLLTKPSAGH